MANTDTELIIELRSLTGYSDAVIADETWLEMIKASKQEVRAEAGLDIPDFYDYEHRSAERALFWTCSLFSKIYMGELEGLDFNIGSIKIHQLPVRDITRVWYEKIDTHISNLRNQSSGFGSRSVNRGTREYGGGDW